MEGGHINAVADGRRGCAGSLIPLGPCLILEMDPHALLLFFGEVNEPGLVPERTFKEPGTPGLVPYGTGELPTMELAAILSSAALSAKRVVAADSRAAGPKRLLPRLVRVVPIRLPVNIVLGVDPWIPAG